jgi:hypothetical protein
MRNPACKAFEVAKHDDSNTVILSDEWVECQMIFLTGGAVFCDYSVNKYRKLLLFINIIIF